METIVHSTLVPYDRTGTSPRFGTKLHALLTTIRLRPAKWILVLWAMLLSVVTIQAATKTVATNGNWSSTATWGGALPLAGDDVLVPNGLTLTLDMTTPILTSVTVTASSGSATLAVGANVLNTGSIVLNGGTTAAKKATISVSTGTINCTGNLTFGGTTASAATVTFTGAGILNIGGTINAGGTYTCSTSTLNCNGSTAQSIAGYTYNVFKANNSAGVTLTSNATITTLTIGDVTSSSFSGGGFTVTPGASSTLNVVQGTYKLLLTWPTWNTVSLAANTTVEYAATTGTQTINAAQAYKNLTFSGAGTKSVGAGVTLSVTGNWDVSSPTTLTTTANVSVTGNISGSGSITAGSGDISLGGNWSNAGTFTKGTGTVTYNGTSTQSVGALSYNNLTLSGSGQKNAAGAIGIAATLTNSTVLDMAGYALTLGTTTTNTSGTIRFNGTSNGLVIGTGTVEYYGATQNVATGTYATLLLTAAGTKTALGNITATTIDNGGSGNAASILDMKGYTLSVVPENTSATVRFSGATNGLAIGTGTVEYYGTTLQTVSAGTYSSLKVSNSVGATISSATTAPTLTIDASGILNVSPTTPLTATTAITNNGTLNLQSDATGTATILTPASAASITGSGTTNVSQYLTGSGGSTPNSRFWYTSNPLDGATTSGFGIGASSKLWKYTETGHAYTQIVSNETMDKGRGYVSRLGANTTITHGGAGVKLTTGTQTVSITRTETDGKKGYNLVGNPYASYVTLSLADNPNIETSMWYRSMNPTSNGMVYDTRNMETGITVVNSISGPLTGDIAPMQAFWVRSTTVGTSNLTFKQTNTKHQPGTVKLRSAEVAQAPTIRVNVSNGIVSDETVIGFYANAKDTYDNYDSYKFSNENAAVPELFTFVGTEEVAINGLAPLEGSRELALGFRTGTAGTFSLNATEISNMEEGMNVYLKDKMMNVMQDLKVSPKYTFTSDIATTDSRFSLLITKSSTQIDQVSETPAFTAFAESNGRVNVQVNSMNVSGAQIKLYGVSGKLLLTKPVESTITTFETNLPQGIYLIELVREGYVGRNKIVINK